MAADATTTLLSLPTVIWSGAVAGLISLGGIVLANRNSERRQREQLRHDAAEKQRDRIAVLRKEVYLSLFEDVAAVSGHLGSLGSKDPTKDDLTSPINQVMAQLGKVQLVGNQQTALLASELSNLFGESLFKLLAAAQPLHEAKIDIRVSDKDYQENLEEAKRANRAIRSIHESGNVDPREVGQLQKSYDHFRQQFETAGTRLSAAWEHYNSLQESFLEAVNTETQLIGPAQAKLMASMREEIGLTADPEFMLNRLEGTRARIRKATENFLSKLRSDRAGD